MSRSLKLAFILDPLHGLKAYKDSSIAMMRAANERGLCCEFGVDRGNEGRRIPVDHGIDHRELRARVGRQARRSFEVSHDVVRRHRDIDRGETELGRSRS